ncbi:hypothetical protein RH915_05925 [Serpentinicella sp. ANB-PHB4]|uniref:hypothetical protein n=1 Tax=Serpentinicella sp. ANB-PHB4 TaxID=3074076 RepID=UPI002858AC1F|nr:hypothetical protein [Serpentinicella sp. ANB-PHB4]MDR5659021.1 hypothetical protein [Serpentinicella sp. ANB-PHB4]
MRTDHNLIILFLLIIFVVYLPLFVITLKRIEMKLGKKKFFRGVISVFDNCTDDKYCVNQLNVLYKRVSSRYNIPAQEMRSAIDLMEEFLINIDTTHNFKELYGLEIKDNFRDRIVNCINIMRQLQPFSSISSKEANLLNVLKKGIETQNKELALNSLEQLADDIVILEEGLRKQSRHNTYSYILSVLGLILTLFFGLLSFTQLILF